MAKFDFEDLKVYQKSLLFIDLVYILSSKFPKDELFGLTNQFRRAANSIALNLGEGFGESIALNLRYLRIVRGSIRECVVCSTIAKQRNFIDEKDELKTRELLEELSKMSMGYRKYLEKKINEVKTH